MPARLAPMPRLLAATSLIATLAATAGPVPLQSSQCGLGDLGSHVASDCLGYAGGNDSVAALVTLVGASQWHGLDLAHLTQYKDGTVGLGSTTPVFDVQQSPTDASQGRLTFLQGVNGPFVLTLKGGNNWAAYYVAQGGSAGSSFTFDIPGQQGRGLSHASIYTAVTPSGSRTPPVPEPGSLALVLAALGAAGAAARRLRRHQA